MAVYICSGRVNGRGIHFVRTIKLIAFNVCRHKNRFIEQRSILSTGLKPTDD